ncbi:unnamed protein product [Mytilus edulis]|uniref:MAM domain-containing protein n=1 Tax=Mytilus edulis TaxID=6550 RepID=A0A8S3TYS6_MYTED|nr:unnamed protein product [Mytilus edulis]
MDNNLNVLLSFLHLLVYAISMEQNNTGTVNGSCDFENDLCGWSVFSNGTYQWTHGRKTSPENFTGPDRDTTATGDGYYIYTMSETESQANDETDLLSGVIGPNPKQCLTFWYHMYGKHINTLIVFQLNDNRTVELWNESAYQGNKWYFQSLSLNDTGPYHIMFKAIRGNGNKSEIAIDDISITNTDCKRDDGNYIHLNASKIEPGQKSNLTSATVSLQGDACFTFWFHMYGNVNGTLNVYLVSENMTQKLWSRSGNEPDLWQLAFVDILMLYPYQMTLEGVGGGQNRSDIAVDDILLLPGSCNRRDFFLNCNFESVKCNWLASSNNKTYIWTTNKTGDSTKRPDNDHTIGTGFITTSQKCHNIDDSISLHECSKYYQQLNETSLVFDPQFDNCSTVYQDVQTSVKTSCNDMNNSDICTFDLPELIMEHKRCFQLNWLSVEYRCEADVTDTVSSVDTSSKGSSEDDTTVYAVVVSTLVIIIAVALVFTVIVCHLKKRTKSSKLCDVRPITTVTETIDSSGYNIINYNNMTGISIHEKEKNRHEINATNCQPEDIRTAIKQEDTIGNKYESLSTNRNPSEHAYESDPIHTNQYQTLTKQRESDKHFYESTEPAQAQAQDNKTLTGQEDDICHKYEFLSANRNSVEHAYELDVLHTNQYESLTKQREYDKHTYESTEPAQKQDIKTLTKQEDDICNKYESLSTNRNSAEHTYESDSIHNNQYESLTNQRESNEHTNQSNGYELPVSMKQELSQYQSLTTPQRDDRHVYASTGSLQ